MGSPYDLVGIYEITEMLGCSEQWVHQLTRRAGFPQPVAELHMGRVWRRSAIEKWAAKNPGRPSKRRGRRSA